MSSPDRALRRMVVDLAALHPDDASAVLDQLASAQRAKVEALLREFSDFGFGTRAPPSVETTPDVDGSRVSAWLLERLERGERPMKMTDRTRSVLRDCAVRLCPSPHATKASDAPQRFGFWRRLKPPFMTGKPA